MSRETDALVWKLKSGGVLKRVKNWQEMEIGKTVFFLQSFKDSSNICKKKAYST